MKIRSGFVSNSSSSSFILDFGHPVTDSDIRDFLSRHGSFFDFEKAVAEFKGDLTPLKEYIQNHGYKLDDIINELKDDYNSFNELKNEMRSIPYIKNLYDNRMNTAQKGIDNLMNAKDIDNLYIIELSDHKDENPNLFVEDPNYPDDDYGTSLEYTLQQDWDPAIKAVINNH